MLLFADFLLVIGFVLIALILLLLLNAKQKGVSKKLLIFIFVIAFLFNLDYYCTLHNIEILIYSLFLIVSGIEFILGPLILFYVRSLFIKEINLKKFFYHFIPFGLYWFLFVLPYFISVLKEEYVVDYLKMLDNNFFRYYLDMIFLIIYTTIALREFKYYQSLTKNNYSNLDDNDLTWVKRLLIGTLIILILDILLNILVLVFELNNGKTNWSEEYLTGFAIVILIGYLGYYGIRRSRILVPSYLLGQEQLISIKETEQSLVSINEKELKLLKRDLYLALTEDKVYLDDALTLSSLADELSTTNKKISSVLNHHLNTNFYDYINKFRVNDMIDKMKSGKFENYTLMGIAFESGFRSKTSFNRVFKNETGVSPSEYKKRLLHK